MIQSTSSYGIGVLDERLSGLVSGGLHLVIGGPGTGKTVVALQFLYEGVRQGGRVALLTQARPEDVIDLAASIGIDMAPHLRSGRWTLLSYQSGFRERYRRSIEPGEVFQELEEFLTTDAVPDRLVIDTCSPLVESRESGNGAELLVNLLSGLSSTVLLTFAGEHPGALDSGFDFISQRAALVLHLIMSSEGRREMVVRKTLGPVESMGPITFEIRDGLGIVAPQAIQKKRRSDLAPDVRRRVLFVDVPGDLPEELRIWLQESFELVYTTDPVDAFPELARREFGLVAVHIDRRTVDRGLHVMHQLRRTATRPPILVMSPVDVRASDRARALRAGADDFVSGGLDPEELASRFEALLRRGRTDVAEGEGDVEAPKPERPALTDPAGDVRDVVRARLASPASPIFSLVLLRATNSTKVDELAEHVAKQMRHDAGDRMSVRGERVEVYLHGAMAKHAESFLARVRTDRFVRVGAVVYTSPTDRDELVRIVDQ
ncbi:MAG: hypothetical protein AMS25_15245 [Gemmatimonas sp. SM23_52]|nr:MAG: hypothetical protein AMS25_15245 [Gemmatimonas sp. SM23_52]